MIVNLVKGSGVTGAIRYMQGEGRDDLTGKLKQRLGDRSRAELLGGQGCGFEIRSEADAELARKIMEFAARPDNQASRTKPCKLDCLHISLSWAKGQTPDRSEQIKAAEGILAALGMSKARAIYYAHHDAEYPHIHVVASRLDPETGRTYSGHEDVYRTQAWGLQWEREQNQITPAREWMHAIADAARSGNHKALQVTLTEKEATFSRRAVDSAFAWGGYFGEARKAPRDAFLADHEIIPLRETAEGPVKAYTTRHVLAVERALQRDARALHAGTLFALLPQGMVDQRRKFDLTREQAEALRHATEENRLAIIAGQAGVGKSRVFAAIREAYLAEGFEVRGVAWTNKVVVNMRRDGFEANTIASELQRIQREADAWRGGKTVLMVDEAAQLSTSNLAMLLKEARERGAKVILAGDERQLGSVERGGMFGVLRAEFGAAYLEQVQRVKDAAQQRAFNLMHGGKEERNFAGAMAILDERKAIHWSATHSAAVRELGAKYIADVEAAPEKKRLMLARTNEEVRALNTFARTLHRERGALGEDHELATAEGRAAFAVGDRITVTQNAPTRAVRQQGLINGAFGIVTEIAPASGKKHEVTIQLDGVGNNPGPRFRFVVGENRELGEFNGLKHGYATTVYKAQGDTLDQIYVLHSPSSRANSNYVALTRHREDVTLFVAKDQTKNVDELVRQMGQGPDKTAASSYSYVERDVAAKETAREMMHPARSPGDRDLKADPRIERVDAAETARQASTSNETSAPGPVKLDGAFVLSPKPGKTVEGLRDAFARSSNGQDYMEALNTRGFRLAQVDGPDQAESVQRREDAEAANIRRKPRVLEIGELVAINRHGSVYSVNAYSTGANQAAIKGKLEGVDRATLPNLSTAYRMQREAGPQRGGDLRALEAARARGEAQGKAVGASMRGTKGDAKHTTMRAIAGFGVAAARVLEGIARMLEDFSLSPEQHAERKAMDQAIREAMPTRQEIHDYQHEQAYRREQDQKSADRQMPESQRHADAAKQFAKDLGAERQHETGWDTGRERGSGSR